MEDNRLQELKRRLMELLEKKDWTREETEWVLNCLESTGGEELQHILREQFEQHIRAGSPGNNEIENAEILLRAIHERAGIPLHRKPGLIKKLWKPALVAASLALVLIFLGNLVFNSRTAGSIAEAEQSAGDRVQHDVEPGTDKAVLILDNGSEILLDEIQNGTLARQGDAAVIKSGKSLNYLAEEKKADRILYNTIATPYGGQYKVELSDGTKVWLNAGSSLRFPTTFRGAEREVAVTGEVYFEVAENPSMPFIVDVSGARIKVLGTHFNVMAYSDEPAFETTLLEGAVQFIKNGEMVKLNPGQQVQLLKGGKMQVRDDVNMEKIVAWKNGYFKFDGLDFATIARQLSRWYNVEVIYDKKIDDLFFATIPRDTRLSVVLKALELTGKVRFEIEGNKILVLP
ncbi:MAG: FecR domain-containing protein [Chitinophagaceae bacterium]|nr:FecR domain-containing protein [Chitinophagaceae bacterium]